MLKTSKALTFAYPNVATSSNLLTTPLDYATLNVVAPSRPTMFVLAKVPSKLTSKLALTTKQKVASHPINTANVPTCNYINELKKKAY